jgi:uncharacterized protein
MHFRYLKRQSKIKPVPGQVVLLQVVNRLSVAIKFYLKNNMKYKRQFLICTVLYLLMFCPHISEAQPGIAGADTMLCTGGFFSEEEGRQFLARQRALYTNENAWKKRASNIKQQILQGAGLKTFPVKTPFNAVAGKVRQYKGYSVQNVAFESLPGVFVTASIYRPQKITANTPGILSTHGHFKDPGEVGRYRPDAQKRCAVFARMGAIVLSVDMVGYGQMEAFGWQHENKQTLKLQLWNNIRAIDFLISLGANEKKIACTGASGGATQAILLAAIDERIAVVAPVVMVSAYFFGGCVCESGMPIHRGIGFQTNNVEIAACAAPRPLLLVSDGNDWTKNTPQDEFPHIQYIYSLLARTPAAENVHLPQDQHGYDYNKRAAVYPFFAKHLGMNLSMALNSDSTLREQDIVIEAQLALYPFDAVHPLPKKAIKKMEDIVWK